MIGSHSHTHPDIYRELEWEQMVVEWRRSCEVLSEIVGEPVHSASVPGGYYSRAVAETAAQAGVTDLFNSEPTTRVQDTMNDILLRVGGADEPEAVIEVPAKNEVAQPRRRAA